MDHQTALSSKAAERFTLGELTSSEKEAFEAHFFSCPECSAAVQEYEIFSDNIRAVFAEDARSTRSAVEAPDPTGWWKGVRAWFGAPIWVPALAIALAFFMFRAPAAVEEWQLVPMSRGEGAVPHHLTPSATQILAPSLDLHGMDSTRWQSYHWVLSSAGGNVVENGTGRENPLKLHIQASKLVPGAKYILTVRGDHDSDSQKPFESSFAIDFK